MRKVLYLMGILNDTDVQWLANKGRKMIFEAGSTLITQGSPVQHLFIVLDGRLSVEVNSMQVATLMTGEVIGEISFVDSRPPLASVVAQVATIVLAVEKAVLKKKLEADGQFGSRFYRAIALFLADRLRTTTGRLGYTPATEEEEAIGDDLRRTRRRLHAGNLHGERPLRLPDPLRTVTTSSLDTRVIGTPRVDVLLDRLPIEPFGKSLANQPCKFLVRSETEGDQLAGRKLIDARNLTRRKQSRQPKPFFLPDNPVLNPQGVYARFEVQQDETHRSGNHPQVVKAMQRPVTANQIERESKSEKTDR